MIFHDILFAYISKAKINLFGCKEAEKYRLLSKVQCAKWKDTVLQNKKGERYLKPTCILYNRLKHIHIPQIPKSHASNLPCWEVNMKDSNWLKNI